MPRPSLDNHPCKRVLQHFYYGYSPLQLEIQLQRRQDQVEVEVVDG
ncbi:hypothetical protein LINGRAHAP2_LOCUS23776 [Linum grandiflorum]